MKSTVILVDDHAVVRDGLQLLLETHDDISVVGHAANIATAMELLAACRPNVVVMDITLPGMNGIDGTRAIRTTYPETQVLILSMHATQEYLFQALLAGACGYILKEVAGNEVVSAVRATAQGERFFSQKITELFVDIFLKHYQLAPLINPLDLLSAREREILKRVIAGQSSKKMAEELFLSPKTIETYRSRLMEKLDVHDIPSLVKLGLLHSVEFYA